MNKEELSVLNNADKLNEAMRNNDDTTENLYNKTVNNIKSSKLKMLISDIKGINVITVDNFLSLLDVYELKIKLKH